MPALFFRPALPVEDKWLPAVLEIDGHASRSRGKEKALLSAKLAHVGSGPPRTNPVALIGKAWAQACGGGCEVSPP